MGEPFGFDPITSTLIFGEYDAVLVDAMGTVAEAEALANWIAQTLCSFPALQARLLPSASVRIAVTPNPGDLLNCRNAIFSSFVMAPPF